MTYLNCEDNKIEELPELPDTLRHLICSNNRLKKLPKLPENLLQMDCHNNEWEEPIKIEIIDRFYLYGNSSPYTKNQIELFNSEEFQRKFLTENPERFRDLTILDLEIHPTIRKEFNYIFEGEGMGFFELKTKESK